MIDLRLTTVADPTQAQLDAFKEFASINAGSDALLLSMLKRAMMAVQDWEDHSLLAVTAVLTVTDREDPYEPILLYGSVASVTSVVDGAGNDVEYTRVGRLLVPSYRTAAVTITYTTAVSDADLAELMPKVYRYAAALYDGEDSSTLNRILQEK